MQDIYDDFDRKASRPLRALNIAAAAIAGALGLFAMFMWMTEPARAADWQPRVEAPSDETGFYLGLMGGAQWLADLDAGGGLRDEIGGFGGAAAGYDFGFFRAELEGTIGYNSLDVGPADVNIWTPAVFVNGLIDFDNSASFTPYVGGGIGYGLITLGPVSESAMAWQALAGVSIDLTDHTSVSAGYRFRRWEDVEILGADLGHVDSHGAEIGLRFRF